jgi:hypothetical protein
LDKGFLVVREKPEHDNPVIDAAIAELELGATTRRSATWDWFPSRHGSLCDAIHHSSFKIHHWDRSQ